MRDPEDDDDDDDEWIDSEEDRSPHALPRPCFRIKVNKVAEFVELFFPTVI